MMVFEIGKDLFSYTNLQSMLTLAKEENVLTESININEYTKKLIDSANFCKLSDEERKEIMAYAAYYDNHYESGIAFLSFIYVYKKHRGKNLAAGLLNHIIKHLKEKNFFSLKLEVQKNNSVAIKVYQKIGFEIESETQSKSLIMTLAL